MTAQHEVDGGSVDRFHPQILLLFVASGAAALIYEVVWFHLLRQVVGASAPSLAIVLGSFMGGLCIGSLGFARFVPATRHPLFVYGVIEAGVAAFGLAMLLLLPLVGGLYLSVVGYGVGGLILRVLVCGLCLLPPTILMGATLPAISRLLETTRLGASRMGLFYAANTVGGVLGCLAAGFYLLRVYDIVVSTFVAAALNLLAAGAALMLARASTYEAPPVPETTGESTREPWVIHLAIALSGLTALGAQVVWTRQLSMVFGATVFSFNIILAVFLVGIASGSGAGAMLARQVRSPWLALAGCQFGLIAAIPYAAHVMSLELPYWHLNPELSSGLVARYVHDLFRAGVAILPATALWGASFPFALAAAAANGQEPSRLSGRIYGANTIGSIVGATLFSLVMIPVVGSAAAQKILAGLAGLTAILLIATLAREERAEGAQAKMAKNANGSTPLLGSGPVAAGVVLTAAMTLLLTQLVPPLQAGVIGMGRRLGLDPSADSYPFVAEGMHSSVAVGKWEDGHTSLHVSGKSVASNYPEDLRLQRMLGHYPALFHDKPKSVLIVGMGTGVTAGSFIAYPEIERIVICEIEPLTVQAAGAYFEKENLGLLKDPRVEVIHDDARHFLASTREEFDIITSDPIHPWMEGAAALFTREYYELAKAHLKPGGVVAQWVPAYETDIETVRSELVTFFSVFPKGTVWSSHIPMNAGNDFVMIAKKGPFEIYVDAIQARIDSNRRVRESLEEVDYSYIVTFMAAYTGRGPDLQWWLHGAEINRDRSLRLQYLAGRAIDEDQEIEIYRAVAKHRKFPRDLIIAPSRVGGRLEGLWN